MRSIRSRVVVQGLWCLLWASVGSSAAQTVDVRDAVASTVQGCAPTMGTNGLLLSAWRSVNTADSSAIWETADSVSLPGNATSVLDVYNTIVQFKEAPLFLASRDQHQRRAAAEDVLLYRRTLFDRLFGRNRERWQSKRFEAYRRYSRQYATARDAFERGPGAGSPAARDAMDTAMHAWVLRGYKTEVLSALSAVKDVDALDANAVWGTRATVLANAAASGEGRPAVTFSPAVADWQSADGWSRCGPLAHGATTVSFDLKLVSVRRDWFDETVFSDRQWRWLSSVPRGPAVPLSAGKGTGRLPWIPHPLVLVRRAVIEQSGGFRSETPSVTAIGWLGDPVPLSPDPQPGLQWGLPQPVVVKKPFVTGVGVLVGTALDAGTFDSLGAMGRHVVGPNAYVQFGFAEWLMVGTAMGPHVRPGAALAVKLPLPNERLELFAGVRIGRGHDGSSAQGLVGFAMPLWKSKSR